MKNTLINAIEEIARVDDKDKQNVAKKGQTPRLYSMVHTRVEIFRKHYGEDSRIDTEIIDCDLEVVRMKATASVRVDGEWRVLGMGHAEEFRGEGYINPTSALENCETSAIGRSLASLGIHGGEYASAFEVDNAKNAKASAPNVNEGYNIVGLRGTVINNCSSPDEFYKTLRILVSDPEKKNHREIYDNSKAVVRKAIEDAETKAVKEGLTNMMAAYGDADE